MDRTTRIAYIKRQVPDVELTDTVIGDKLDEAVDAVMAQRYPFGIPETATDVPSQYERLTLQLAIRYINRMGVEGETSHNENGISRGYADTVDADLLDRVIPVARLTY